MANVPVDCISTNKPNNNRKGLNDPGDVNNSFKGDLGASCFWSFWASFGKASEAGSWVRRASKNQIWIILSWCSLFQ